MTNKNILTHSYYSDFYAQKGYNFLKSIANGFSTPDNLVIFSVMHCYEGSLPYINVLSELAEKLVFVPKGATLKGNGKILSTIESIPNCDVVDLTYNKSYLKDPEHCLALIKQYVTPDKQFLLLDHGGYFSHAIETIIETFREQCVGITELTANGFAKYLNHTIEKPLVTVSNLSIKQPADFEASECIVHYSDQILREVFGLKLNNVGFLKIGVIGTGNLGRGIIKSLSGKGIKDLYVADADPRRLTGFPRDGIYASSVNHLIRDCNMIFCCTGNGALPAKLLDELDKPLFIATVTSADDELNLPQLVEEGVLYKVGGNSLINEYKNRRNQSVYLLAGGESANTPFKTGMGDPTLYLFEAAHMLAGLKLINCIEEYRNGLQALSEKDEMYIAEKWLQHFYDYR